MKLARVSALLLTVFVTRAVPASPAKTDSSDETTMALSDDILEPEAIRNAPSRLELCSEIQQNVFLLIDVSGSIQAKARLRKFRTQRRYVEKVLDAFGSAGSTSVRFGISAYSRFAAHVRSLTNPRSGDVEYMKRSIQSFKHFKHSKWDSPNGYKILIKKGKHTNCFITVLSRSALIYQVTGIRTWAQLYERAWTRFWNLLLETPLMV